MLFYKEVYYRHVYARTQQPNVEQRLESYHNYCTLFGYIINPPSDDTADIELPLYWTWDIIDEFIYQFNSFHIFRNRAIKKNATAELEILEKNPGAWSAYSVLNVLYSLAGKANMSEQLRAMNAGQDPTLVAGKYGQKGLYKTLGYFSIIGLLRVHCLLGDFSLALKTMDGIQLNKKALFARVASAYFTTYYYVGFSYLMLHRYADAIKAFSHILLYISRTKNINRSAQFDQVTKKSEQMYALLAMCVTLSPTRLDDVIHTGLREKYGDQLVRMQRGGPESIKTFEELFLFAAPKFISPSPCELNDPQAVVDPIQHHLQVFLATVQNATLGTTLKSYLNLYATMDISKLSSFLDTNVDDLRSALVCSMETVAMCPTLISFLRAI
jgi:translation initiation factor 3 subunit L